MLGNVLDNACRFATAARRRRGATVDAAAVVTIDDDGPGLDPALARRRAAARRQGGRVRTRVRVLGLRLCRDLVEPVRGAQSPSGVAAGRPARRTAPSNLSASPRALTSGTRRR